MGGRYYVLGFSRKMHLFARLIMLFTDSKASHCYVRQVDGAAVDYVLEATAPGVGLTTRSVFLRHGATVVSEYLIDADLAQLDRAWERTCYERLGLPYSWLQIVGDAWVIILREWFGIRRSNPFGQPWADVCSELALYYLLAAQIPGFDKLDPETVSPQDLLDVIPSLPRWFTQLEEPPPCNS